MSDLSEVPFFISKGGPCMKQVPVDQTIQVKGTSYLLTSEREIEKAERVRISLLYLYN